MKMAFQRDEQSGPWKVVDAERGISASRHSDSGSVWVDVSMGGQVLTVEYKDSISGADERKYMWHVTRVSGGGGIKNHAEIKDIIKELVESYAHFLYQDKVVTAFADFSQVSWG